MWLPDYVNVDVDGDPLRIEGELIRQNISSAVLYDCRKVGKRWTKIMDNVAKSGLKVW